MRSKLIAGLITTWVLAQTVHGQVEITSFDQNGKITWSAPSNSHCTIEWASSLTPAPQWSRWWMNLRDIPCTNSTSQADVPMFYRVMCWTNGLFLPLPLGRTFVYQGSNNLGQVWTQELACVGSLSLTTMTNDYIQVFRKEIYSGPEPVETYGDAFLYIRSDSDHCYFLEDKPQESLIWQDGPIGTTWTNDDGTLVVIQTNETVVVPAGTFPGCIKFRKSGIPQTPTNTWYEWIKPGSAIVRIEDHYCGNTNAAPLVYELQSWRDE